jgi:two-component system, OmpR family, copper resistance phosphate regulon response regulator CusR
MLLKEQTLKILVVEDDKKIAGLIKRGLEEDGYLVSTGHDGSEGIKQALTGDFNLIILDWSLPKKDGVAVVMELRGAGNHTPVLMLTARGATEDIVAGLDAGVDDYLTKPFAFKELVARVRALIRRSKLDRGAEIVFADLRLDPISHKVWRGGNEIDLTGKEYDLMEYMIRNPNTVLSRTMINENVWETTLPNFSNMIDVYITYLRRKIDKDYPTKLIYSVRKQGYVLREG